MKLHSLIGAATVLTTVVLTAACTSSEELENTGRACLWPGASGAVHTMVVEFDACGSPCDELVDERCEVELRGKTLTVEASATLESDQRTNSCPTACAVHSVSCQTPPLTEGEYVILYGDEQTIVQVPVHTPESFSWEGCPL